MLPAQPMIKPATRFIKLLSVVLVLTCSLTIVSTVNAAPVQAHYQLNKKQGISAAQAATIAARSSGGKVLKVNRQGDGYRVKVLQPSGRVKNIWVDARSGKVKGKQ